MQNIVLAVQKVMGSNLADRKQSHKYKIDFFE